MTAEELKQGLLDTFLRVADRFGVPCAILAIVMYFGREAAIAMHRTVMEPIVQGHLEFLDTTAETLKEIGQVQRQQATALQELAHGQRELHEAIKIRN